MVCSRSSGCSYRSVIVILAQEMARELAKKGVTGKLYPRRTDMRKEEDILAAFAWADSEIGGADVLINNAGTSFCGYHSGKDPENKNDHPQIITVI